MVKILLVSNGTEGKDGWAVYTKTLARELEKSGHTLYNTQNLGTPLSYYTNPFCAVLNAYKLKKYIRKIQPDIMHITVEPYSAMLPLLGKNIAKKTILTIHGSYGIRMFQGAINAKRSAWILRHIHACITVSEYTKKRVTEEVAIKIHTDTAQTFSKKTSVIKNGIQLPESIASPKNTVQQILCVGGVKPRKGILESLKAIQFYIQNIDKNIHFTIAGTYNAHSAYMQELQNYIHANSLKKYITFTNTLSDTALQDLYKQTDLYLMPAKTTYDTFEGFGIVYIEAAGYGIPCIGTNDSGAAEAIDEGVSGYKCDPHDAHAIAEAIENILQNKKIRRTECRKWAEQHSAQHMAKSIEELYVQISSEC